MEKNLNLQEAGPAAYLQAKSLSWVELRIVVWAGLEPRTSGLQVRCPNHSIMHAASHFLPNCPTDWLFHADWLSDLMPDSLSYWLTGWLPAWHTVWLTDWLTSWLKTACLTDWLTDLTIAMN